LDGLHFPKWAALLSASLGLATPRSKASFTLTARLPVCRDMAAPLGLDDMVQFPYGVVEIKLQAKPPQWIKDLVQSGACSVSATAGSSMVATMPTLPT
jgi:hypothetical protein